MRALTRWAALVLALLGGCSSDQVVLMIHVTNLTPDVTGLQVRAQLDDRPSQQVTYAEAGHPGGHDCQRQHRQGQLSFELARCWVVGCSSAGAQYNATVELVLACPWKSTYWNC